jgi:hypothetical protein
MWHVDRMMGGYGEMEEGVRKISVGPDYIRTK